MAPLEQQQELKFLRVKTECLSRANDQLRRQVFEATQRVDLLAAAFGFRDASAAEAAVSANANCHHIDSRVHQSQRNCKDGEIIKAYENVLGHKDKEATAATKLETSELLQGTSTRQKDISTIKAANPVFDGTRVTRNDARISSKGGLDRPSDGMHSLSTTTVDPTSAVALQHDLAQLQKRYDALLEVKERAAARYKSDYAKWKSFKKWLLEDNKRSKRLKIRPDGRSKDETTGPVKNRRKLEGDFSTPHRRGRHLRQTNDSSSLLSSKRATLVDGLSITSDDVGYGKLSLDKATLETENFIESPRHSQAQQRVDRILLENDASSETEDDSQAQNPTSSYVDRLLESDRETTIGRSVKGKRRFSEISDLEDGTPSRTLLSNANSEREPLGAPMSFALPQGHCPAGMQVDDEKENIESLFPRIFAHQMSETSISASPTTLKFINDTGALPKPYSGKSGKGRHAKAVLQDTETTINALYEVDRDQNNGLNFQFDAVVRSKKDRRHLKGGDCECCREYYEAVGPLPQRLEMPLWSSKDRDVRAASGSSREQLSTDSRKTPAAVSTEQHMNEISRHRHQWAPPSTPPGYWNIGFPDTQEAADINEQAKDLHRIKMRHVEAEATKEGGFYKRRQ